MKKHNSKEADGSPPDHDVNEAGLGLARVTDQPMALTLDTVLYERYLAESDLTEAQKREFLQSLWSLIVGFVDLGFGIHPLQQSGNAACGQNFDPATVLAADMVPSLMPSELEKGRDATKAKEVT